MFGSIIGGYAAIKNDRIKQDIKKKDSADKFAIRGFNCEKLKINFLSDDKIHSHTMLKTIVGENIEDELDIFRLSILINEQEYTNTRNFELMEMAIIDLQKQLPDDMQIICCQTCKYGNYNPFGDNDNEMFCLINHSIKSKSDLIHLITANPHDAFTINKLTHWCEKYEKINDDYYTYNDWIYHFKDDKKY